MNARRIVFATLSSLALVAALSAMPPAHNTQTAAEQTAAAQSVSGKITAVAKDSFTLAVAAPGTAQHFAQTTSSPNQTTPSPKSMTFVVDKNTTIEGKLKVNALADVTYREDSGRNIAIGVHVTE